MTTDGQVLELRRLLNKGHSRRLGMLESGKFAGGESKGLHTTQADIWGEFLPKPMPTTQFPPML